MSDQPQINLNVTDISDAVKVIDHACEQGAFRGWTNIRQILALRDRLDMFASAAAAVTNVPEEDGTETAEGSDTTAGISPPESPDAPSEDDLDAVACRAPQPRRQRVTRRR